MKLRLIAWLDDKVITGKLVPYWRHFLKLYSIRWSLSGFLIALANAVSMVYGMKEPLREILPHVVLSILGACVFIAVMWTRMRPQDVAKKDRYDDSTE